MLDVKENVCGLKYYFFRDNNSRNITTFDRYIFKLTKQHLLFESDVLSLYIQKMKAFATYSYELDLSTRTTYNNNHDMC